MKLTFHGGAGTVTGANYLLQSGGTKILIDCGLQQGSHFAEKENYTDFAYDAKEIAAVFVTHAHIDHTGRLPKLYADGFRGRIISTPPTRDFAELLLIDSEHILRKEAAHEGKAAFCTPENIDGAMKLWEGVAYHKRVKVGPFSVELWNAGHILGSAIIHIEAEGKTIVFSGDLGNFPAPIIKDTERVPSADYCLIESTYGNRVHEDASARQGELEQAIVETVRDRGVLMIPAFAMERTQDLIYHLNGLVEAKRLPPVPIFLDSPLAIHLTEVYKRYQDYFDDDVREQIRRGDDIFEFRGLTPTLTTEQSKEVNRVPAPKIIIAGSGMSNGGRILHHELRYLSDPDSMILFVGYQARGTLGRAIQDGASRVAVLGEEVAIRCKRRSLSGYSAHADQPRLVEWLSSMKTSLKKVFLVQGEEDSIAALAGKVQQDLGLATMIPKAGETVEL